MVYSYLRKTAPIDFDQRIEDEENEDVMASFLSVH